MAHHLSRIMNHIATMQVMTMMTMTMELLRRALALVLMTVNPILNKGCLPTKPELRDGVDTMVGSVFSPVALAGQGPPLPRIVTDDATDTLLYMGAEPYDIAFCLYTFGVFWLLFGAMDG
jgi:hypothetical protein